MTDYPSSTIDSEWFDEQEICMSYTQAETLAEPTKASQIERDVKELLSTIDTLNQETDELFAAFSTVLIPSMPEELKDGKGEEPERCELAAALFEAAWKIRAVTGKLIEMRYRSQL